LNFEDFS